MQSISSSVNLRSQQSTVLAKHAQLGLPAGLGSLYSQATGDLGAAAAPTCGVIPHILPPLHPLMLRRGWSMEMLGRRWTLMLLQRRHGSVITLTITMLSTAFESLHTKSISSVTDICMLSNVKSHKVSVRQCHNNALC